MQTAGRLVLFGMILAMLLGGGVLLWRNDFSFVDLFDTYWGKTLRSNATYYPEVGRETLPAAAPGVAEADPSWASEGY